MSAPPHFDPSSGPWLHPHAPLPPDGAGFLPSDLSVTPLTFHVSPPAGHRKWLFHGCECAGVGCVRSAGPGPPVEGRIQCHGLLPGGTISVCNHCSGLLSLSLGRDETISVFVLNGGHRSVLHFSLRARICFLKPMSEKFLSSFSSSCQPGCGSALSLSTNENAHLRRWPAPRYAFSSS